MGSSGAGRATWPTGTARTTFAARTTSSGFSGWPTMPPAPTTNGHSATGTPALWQRRTGPLKS
eukprot:9236069-Lingulodinium_polyedra.AAC.1